MSTNIHVFTASLQDATNFVVDGHRFRCGPRALRRCWRCGKLRWAKSVRVQVFYDSIRYWCKNPKCKRN